MILVFELSAARGTGLGELPASVHNDVLLRGVLAGNTIACAVDQTLNPLVSSVKPSKTMALTDLASSMREEGIDVRAASLLQFTLTTSQAT